MVENITRSERFSSPVCQENFQNSLDKLSLLKESSYYYSPECLGVVAKRLTSVVIADVEENNPRFELFLERNPRSGYKMCDHEKICSENGINWAAMRCFFGLYFESTDDKRFLIFDPITIDLNERFDSIKFNYERKTIVSLVEAVGRYKIDTIITRVRNIMSLAWNSDKFIEIEDYGQQIDKFINNEWTSNLAMELGWTNTELLRFKLNNELPPKKR